MRICNTVKNNHELQHRLHKHIYHIRGTHQKHKDRFFKAQAVTGAVSRTGIRNEQRELTVDPGASVEMVSKHGLIHEEKRTVRKLKESCTMFTASGSITATEEATVYVRDLDMFMTVKLLEASPAVLSLGQFWEEHWYSFEGKEAQSHTSTKDGRITECELENFVPKGRTWSHCRRKSPKRFRSCIGRPTVDSFGRARAASSQTGCSHLRKDLVDGESGSSSSDGDTILRTLPRRNPARTLETNLEGTHNLYSYFPKDPRCDYLEAHKNDESSMQEES